MDCRSLIFRAARFSALFLFAFVCWGQQVSRAQVSRAQVSGVQVSDAEVSDAEKAHYADAVAYCRGDVARPMALSADKRVLCYDGEVSASLDISAVEDFEDGGLFVVRSYGGYASLAVELAEILRERHATVVTYDYCLSACAAYLLVASTRTFVFRNTLVAWHHWTGPYWCPAFEEAQDGGSKRLVKHACSDAPSEYQYVYKYYEELDDWFYATRTVLPYVDHGIIRRFEAPPESIVVRRLLRRKFEGTGTYPGDLLWTWNPRYYTSAIKTKIIYEAYPKSQDEVDAMAARLQVHVIYDP